MEPKDFELEILKLVYDYSRQRKIIDKAFIDNIVAIIVSAKDLNKYILNLKFTDNLSKNDSNITCAAYNFIRKEIIVDCISLQIAMEENDRYGQYFQEFEQIMLRNLTILQIMLHELEHAYQNKQADEKSDNSTETKIVKACLRLEQAIKNPKFILSIINGEISEQDFLTYVAYSQESYKKYYKFEPTERLAQINSFSTIISSLKPIQKNIPNLYEFQNAQLIEEMLRGYEETLKLNMCPTLIYFLGNRQENVWTKLDFYSDDFDQLLRNVYKEYDLNKRLTLGLPIKQSEYNSVDQYLKNTNKYNN